jgi:hypothetical protein
METNVGKTKAIRISKHKSPAQIMIDKKKQPENVEYFNCFGSRMTSDARCTP